MLSIFLIGLIVSYLYGTLGELKHSNDLLFERDKQLNEDEVFLNLLRRDLLEAESSAITNGTSENSLLSIKTKNSLYNSYFAHVKWFVNSEKNLLIRAEAPIDFSIPITMDKFHKVRIESFRENVENLKIYLSKDGYSVLFSFKDINSSKIFAVELMTNSQSGNPRSH